MTSKPLDPSKREAFGQRMLEMLNHAAVILMTSVGHRTGLFDALAPLRPSTSAEIASAAGLHERYVREWLGAMVTAGIIEYDPERKTYHLPSEHAAWLTRAASPNNLAVQAQFIPVLAMVEDAIIDCFRHGGGVPYASFKNFHHVMAEESAQTVVSALLEQIVPLVPGLPERLAQGIDVLDVGCGSGRALNLLARAFPNSRFTGYDLSPEAVAAGRAEAEQQGCRNIQLEARDVATMEAKAAFDLITAFDAIHDQAQPARVLGSIAAALRDDGTFLMQDIATSSHLERNLDHPVGPYLYTVSCMHCMTVSLAAGGAGLGAAWGEETAVKMLREAGFANVQVQKLPHDIINNYYIAAKR